jgi:radical SAM superfamily enzyme YgiQ (UPF0313 family)
MKIAFVSANRERLPDEVTPLGLLYVMASTPARHEKVLWDLCFEPDPTRALAARLEAFQPDVVALGLRNIQNSDYTGTIDNLNYYAALIATVRARSLARIVVGGAGFSVLPRGLMERLHPDFGISGEGEHALSQLLDALERGAQELAHIGNLHFFKDGALVSTASAEDFMNLDRLPPPDRRLLDGRYFEQVGIDSVQTKRGCPLKCDYCTYPIIEGKSIRQRDPEAVVDEMFQAIDAHPALNHFFIVDSVFNLPPKHAKEVCRAMIRRGFKTPWTCYANPLGFDQELADLMAHAGCAGMEIGSDSGCDEVLLRLKKGFTTEKIRAIHRASEKAGLPDCHAFILGTQGETLENVHRTLDFIVDLDPYGAVLLVWTDDLEALDSALRAERAALREQTLALLEQQKAQFPRWIIPPLGVNFSAGLFNWLRRKGLRGPLWQHIKMLPKDPGPGRLSPSAA